MSVISINSVVLFLGAYNSIYPAKCCFVLFSKYTESSWNDTMQWICPCPAQLFTEYETAFACSPRKDMDERKKNSTPP